MTSTDKPTNENTREFPSFNVYINSIEKFVTYNDETFFIRFKWLSPMKLQITDIYFIKIELESKEKYLKSFKCLKLICNLSELEFSNVKSKRSTLFSCKKDNDKFILTSITKLPYEIF